MFEGRPGNVLRAACFALIPLLTGWNMVAAMTADGCRVLAVEERWGGRQSPCRLTLECSSDAVKVDYGSQEDYECPAVGQILWRSWMWTSVQPERRLPIAGGFVLGLMLLIVAWVPLERLNPPERFDPSELGGPRRG